MAGTGVAARYGILIKDAEALEWRIGSTLVAFDKTGTLTVGAAALGRIRARYGRDASPCWPPPRACKAGSEHPLARAVVAAAGERGLSIEAPRDVRAVAGRGTEGEAHGRAFVIASLRWLRELGVEPGELQAQVDAQLRDGATVSVLLQRTEETLRLRALMAFADEPKPGAREALQALRERGLRLAMISGDGRAAALAMARRLGLADMRPECN